MTEAVTKKIPTKPLVCTPGDDRPSSVDYVDKEECSTWDAFIRYGSEAQKLDEFCKKIPYECEEHAPPSCAKYDICYDDNNLPQKMKDLGIWKVSAHPFMEITYHLDRWGIDDFRSAEVFNEMADDVLIDRLTADRELSVLYPASGSHMGAMLLPLKLIDKGRIDSAKIVYTEIDEKSVQRVDEYMKFLVEEKKCFTEYERKRIEKEEGYEIQYSFKYKGKDVSFVFGMDRGGEVYSPDEYIQEAELIIFHDGVTKKGGISDKFVQKLDEYSEGEYAKPRVLISEDQWDCSDKWTCKIGEKIRPFKQHKGYYYGCGKDWSPEGSKRYVSRVVDGEEKMVASEKEDEFKTERAIHKGKGWPFNMTSDPIMVYIPAKK